MILPGTADAGDDAPRPPLGEVLGPLPTWAVASVLAASVGEAVAVRAAPGVWLAAAAGSVGLVASIVLLVAGARADRAGHGRPGAVRAGTARVGGAVALLAVVAVGVAAPAARVATTELGLLPRLAARGGSLQVTATVVAEPRPLADRWLVVLRVDAVGGATTRERAVIEVQGAPPALGRRLVAHASARPLPAGGYGRWLARHHAVVLLDAPRWDEVGQPGPMARASEHVRERIRAAATARQPARVGGLLTGFVTGDTRLLPAADAEAMRATGLTHLTAVSGTHVAILVAGILAVTSLLRLGARPRRWTLAVALLGFAFLTRFSPSVLRAGVMGALVLLAGARGVPRDPLHALAGAVLLLVLVDPLLAGSLGLLLSASAAAGVLLVAPVVRARLHGLPHRLAEVLAVTVGAQLAVVPLLLATFGEVPLASVPANVLAVPAAAVAIAGAFVAALAAVVEPSAAAWLFAAAGVPARAVLAVAHRFADVGWSATTARPVTVAALALGATWLLRRPRRGTIRTALAAATAGCLVVAALPLVAGRVPVRTFTVTAIDVGQGDAFLVESPAARVLVDAGPDDVAARWLRSNGRRHLDLLVVTHGHLDHVGGAAQVLRTARVGAVWYRPIPTELPEAGDLLTAAHERGVPLRAPVAGDRARVGDLHLEVLSPSRGRPYRWADSELNDSSIVVLITWRDRQVLLTGDVEAAAQADLLALPDRLGRHDLLQVELLTVPHHGSATTDPGFLAAVRPQVALVSVGAGNRHGHPHPEILAVFDALGTRVHRTDREGTVRVEVPAPRAPATDPVGSGHAARAPPRR